SMALSAVSSTLPCDVNRRGSIEDYQNEFRFHYPNEHRPAGRPMKTTPLTPFLATEGAEFTTVNGWERAEFYKPAPDFHVTHGFHVDEAEPAVAAEVNALHTGVGLAEVNGFNRIEITGADTHRFLDHIMCNRVPTRPGRLGLCYGLNHQGCVKLEATIANLPDGPVWYGSAAASEWHDLDWLRAHADGFDVTLTPVTEGHTILLLAGPRARDVLAAACRGDWSNEGFPWLSVRRSFVGIAPAVVMRVSYSGELAYEIHVPMAQAYAAYLALRAAGDGHGLRLFGARAVESMRMEMGYLHWKADLITEFDPFETGLKRFVKMDKDFIGKPALKARQQAGARRQLVLMQLDASHATAQPGASVMHDGAVVGTVTSGAIGHRTGLNLALAFVTPAHAATGTQAHIDVLGDLIAATVCDPPYTGTP
ncbi:MAG: glycine cleavage T C-terminal barrel domain-containing protein, partial [Pseudomonadota bacterium]